MKYKEKLVNLFKNICNTTIKCSIKNRKLSESDYFDAYLDFIDNSIHYSITIIKGINIHKYLNEKFNNLNHNIIKCIMLCWINIKIYIVQIYITLMVK